MNDLNEDDEFSLPMTPMIDIVFLLLIFFLLATTVAEEERDVQIQLPGGEYGNTQQSAAPATLRIGVRRDGTLTLGGNPIEMPLLRQKLLQAGRAAEKPQVFLRGDREAHYGLVAQVLQLCQEARLERVNAEFRLEGRPK